MTGDAGLVARNAPRAWMDLLGDLTDSRVLVVRAPRVGSSPPHGEGCDVVILDGALQRGRRDRRTNDDALLHWATALEPGGRLVVVADNAYSPLRACDRLVGRPTGPAGPRLSELERLLAAAGLAVVQRFGLLRSSAAAVTDFDLDAPETARAVLEAASVATGGGRAVALRALRWAAERGRAAALVPAWLVVAARPDGHRPQAHPTGRLGHADSTEPKLVWGEPPAELEKRYSSRDDADREALALSVLEAAGASGVPRLLGRSGPACSRLSWLPGRPLVPHRLGRRSVARWAVRAARAIATIHRITARPDGSALLHGDFWLGNLLVEGDRVAGIVDWTGARWGDPADDMAQLLGTLPAVVPARQVAHLAALARAAHAGDCVEARRAAAAR